MSSSNPATPSPPPLPDLSGRELGDYQLIRRLGRGAMAEVYLAEQTSLKRQIALKVLRGDLTGDAIYVQRFHNEAQAAAKLTHANIVQIYEVGHIDSIHYIAQEYVPGRNVGELIARQGAFDAKLAVAIMRQVAAALHKAAEHGIVHRDIKPENLLLARTGEVKVADFGLARIQGDSGLNLTQVGVTMGTPLYMSPEQIEGRSLDTRSDLYSLGVTSYHMLAGHPPFIGDSPLGVAVQHLNSTPKRLEDHRHDLPEGLCRIVHKMLNKKPEQRFQSARELLKELRELHVDGMEDGWTEGIDDWSTAELIALSDARIAATGKLQSLMETSAMLVPKKQRRWRWRAAAIAALLLGAVLAAARHRHSLLSAERASEIPRRESVWSQLYHAKVVDTKKAWQSVGDYFPEPQHRFARHLADQGLARHYLSTVAYDEAIPLFESLASATEPEFKAFGIAGLCVVYSALGDKEKMDEYLPDLTPEMVDKLDPRMRAMLRDVLARNQQRMNQAAYEQLRSRLDTDTEASLE